MQLKISTNGYNVLASGTVIFYDIDSEMKLHVEVNPEFEFDMIFVFSKDNKERSIEKKVQGNVVTLTCYNFNDQLGTGTVEPLDVATIGDKKLVLHFWTYVMGDKKAARKIEYTFLEKE